VSRYHGKKGPRLLEILDVCETCYKAKEQEYLNNYEVIFKGTKKEFIWIKKDALDCYAGKKDQNGETLKQENCSHCQP
jgi:hypothetical protein